MLWITALAAIAVQAFAAQTGQRDAAANNGLVNLIAISEHAGSGRFSARELSDLADLTEWSRDRHAVQLCRCATATSGRASGNGSSAELVAGSAKVAAGPVARRSSCERARVTA